MLEGEYAGPLERAGAAARPSRVVVFAGPPHPGEARAGASCPAIAPRPRARCPSCAATIFGDGPERDAVLAAIAAHGLDGVVEAPGFVDARGASSATLRARAVHGAAVARARATGWSSSRRPRAARRASSSRPRQRGDRARRGGRQRRSSRPSDVAEDLAAAIVRVHDGGPALRASTADWFARNARAAVARQLARRGRARATRGEP